MEDDGIARRWARDRWAAEARSTRWAAMRAEDEPFAGNTETNPEQEEARREPETQVPGAKAAPQEEESNASWNQHHDAVQDVLATESMIGFRSNHWLAA